MTKKYLIAVAPLVVLSFGCSQKSDVVQLDANLASIASAPTTEANTELPSQPIDDQTEIQSFPKAESGSQSNVQSGQPTTSVTITPPKFDAKGTTVDLTESIGFVGATEEDLVKWRGIKVVRGKGVLTQGALKTFARCPSLTEFLWLDATLDSSSTEAFVELAKASNLKKVRLTGLRLSDTNEFPDFALKALSQSPSLVDLDISGSPLTADDLLKSNLTDGFKSLTKLNLYQTQVGDAGVDALLPFASRLTSLNLDDVGIGPDSASKIAQFTKLTFLHVGRSKLDDASVRQFAGLTRLEKIHVTRSAVTEAGADELRKALPNCIVVSQPEN